MTAATVASSARLPDWPARLAALIEQRRTMPFRWGLHDCCQWARRVVLAVRGADPAADLALRPYRSAGAARRNLLRLGGIEALPSACGLQEIPVSYAGRGDLVLIDIERGRPGGTMRRERALGVVVGLNAAFAGPEGLQFLPVADCRRAWRV